jgi:predicted nucleic acid-binding protein
VLFAVTDAGDEDHAAVRQTLERWPGELVVPAFCAAEADHLILSRLGVEAQLALLDDLARLYTVPTLDPAGLRKARHVCAQYRDRELGLADASVVVLAQRFKTRTLATLDERRFRPIASLQGGGFRLLPADA